MSGRSQADSARSVDRGIDDTSSQGNEEDAGKRMGITELRAFLGVWRCEHQSLPRFSSGSGGRTKFVGMASNLGAKQKKIEGIICHEKTQSQHRAAAKCDHWEYNSRKNVGHKYLSHLLLLSCHR